MSMAGHRTVRVIWKEQSAEIDEELAEIVLSLWRRGIRTLRSCQAQRPAVSHGGPVKARAYIEFATDLDAQRFVAFLVRADVAWDVSRQDAGERHTVWFPPERIPLVRAVCTVNPLGEGNAE